MIYFDNAATTKPYQEVLNTFIEVNENYYANPASIHQAGVESNTLLNLARQQIAKNLHTKDEHVLFTSGGTESNNFALFGVAFANTHIGKHIITTEIEHASVLEAAKKLETLGFEVDYLKVDEKGVISLDELKQKLRKDTTLVSIMHVNNEMGAIQPIEEAAKLIHENSRALIHVDAVQSFGKLPVRLDDDQRSPDIISISGHKIHAFKGSGLIAFRKKLQISPLLLGGGQEFGLRSGTVAVPQAVALSKAVRLTSENRQSNVEKYEKWKKDLHQFFNTFDDVRLLSTNEGAPHIISLAVLDLKGEIMINALQKNGIIVSTSSACSSRQTKTSHVVEALNIHSNYKKGVIRISFGAHNRDEDIVELKRVFTTMMKEVKGEQV